MLVHQGDRSFSGRETYHVQFFKLGPRQGLREVFPFKERFDFNPSLVLRREGPLGFLDLTAEFLHSSVILPHIFPRLLLVQLNEVLHDPLVKVFPTQVSVAVGGHHFKDAVVNGEKGDIKGSTSQVKNQDVLLALSFVQAVSNGCSRAVERKTSFSLLIPA